MIRMQRKLSLRKTKHKTIDTAIREFTLMSVFKYTNKFIWRYRKIILLWLLANFAFLYIFTLIPNGWTNSLSIIWLIVYYVYWCIFVRCIQQHQPYFSLIRVLNGLIPTSKIMFINIFIYVLILTLPYIPLLMGFRDAYLEFFENYMRFLENHNAISEKIIFSLFLLLISPYTITRPYLAWISSLIGKSRSVMDAYKKTHGNYLNFVLCLTIISIPCLFCYCIDKSYNVKTLYFLIPLFTTYFNLLSISLYKIFYRHRAVTRQSLPQNLPQK